jgi:hypothetical protein
MTLTKEQKFIQKKTKDIYNKTKKTEKEIERVLKRNRMALVATHNKERNMILLELVPVELADARNKLAKQAQEMLAGKGDKISGDNSQNNSAPKAKVPDAGGLDIPGK